MNREIYKRKERGICGMVCGKALLAYGRIVQLKRIFSRGVTDCGKTVGYRHLGKK